MIMIFNHFILLENHNNILDYILDYSIGEGVINNILW